MNNKPLTDNIKQKANAIYKHLYNIYPNYATKEELAKVIGATNERTVRDVINTLRKVKPIISVSSGKGYKLARTTADIEEVRHCWQEIDSRQEELELTKQPLIKFYEQAKKMGA